MYMNSRQQCKPAMPRWVEIPPTLPQAAKITYLYFLVGRPIVVQRIRTSINAPGSVRIVQYHYHP